MHEGIITDINGDQSFHLHESENGVGSELHQQVMGAISTGGQTVKYGEKTYVLGPTFEVPVSEHQITEDGHPRAVEVWVSEI